MGEKQNKPFQLSFNPSLRVDFQASRVTSDGGLIPVLELDERLGFGELIERQLSDCRRRKNTQFTLADLLRQSIYSRIAGYEDTNDAERLSQDPTFRLIGKATRLHFSRSTRYAMGVWPHDMTRRRAAVSLLLVCTMFALGLYLYSPWHQHPAQGRQACRFLQYEQSNGLEAHGQVFIEPPSVYYYQTPDGQTPLVATSCCVKFGCRAPPV